jgi:hypothetical protein
MTETTVLKTAEETVAQQLLRATLDEIQQTAAWRGFPEAQQKELLFRVKAQITEAVQGAVRLIARGGFEHIVARIESMNIKEDGSKATIVVGKGSDLADRVGSRVLIVFVEADRYTEGMDTIQAEADQLGLPGEAGTDTPEASTEPSETVTPAETTVVRQVETVRAASVLVGKLNEGWMLFQQDDNTYEAYSADGTQRAAVWLAAARRVIDDGTAVAAEGATGRWLIRQQQAA